MSNVQNFQGKFVIFLPVSGYEKEFEIMEEEFEKRTYHSEKWSYFLNDFYSSVKIGAIMVDPESGWKITGMIQKGYLKELIVETSENKETIPQVGALFFFSFLEY